MTKSNKSDINVEARVPKGKLVLNIVPFGPFLACSLFLFCYDHLSIVVFRSLCIYYYALHIFQCSLSESQAVIKGGESPAGGGGGGVWKSCLRPRTSTWQPEL